MTEVLEGVKKTHNVIKKNFYFLLHSPPYAFISDRSIFPDTWRRFFKRPPVNQFYNNISFGKC